MLCCNEPFLTFFKVIGLLCCSKRIITLSLLKSFSPKTPSWSFFFYFHRKEVHPTALKNLKYTSTLCLRNLMGFVVWANCLVLAGVLVFPTHTVYLTGLATNIANESIFSSSCNHSPSMRVMGALMIRIIYGTTTSFKLLVATKHRTSARFAVFSSFGWSSNIVWNAPLGLLPTILEDLIYTLSRSIHPEDLSVRFRMLSNLYKLPFAPMIQITATVQRYGNI